MKKKKVIPIILLLVFGAVILGLSHENVVLADVLYSVEEILLAPFNQTNKGLVITNDSNSLIIYPAGFNQIKLNGTVVIEEYALKSQVSSWIEGNKTSGVTAQQLQNNLSNYFTKAESDGRYLQYYSESDPIWSNEKINYFTKAEYYNNASAVFQPKGSYVSEIQLQNNLSNYATITSLGAYSTGTQAINNYTAINNSILSKITWNEAMNGTLALSSQLNNYLTLSSFSAENNTIAHIGSCGSNQFVNALTKNGPSCATPSSGGFNFINGSTTQSNRSYWVITGESMTLTVGSIQRISTAPTINTTDVLGYSDAFNFLTGTTADSDGGFVLSGNAGATNTLTINASKIQYFRYCGRNTANNNRRYLIGVFRTGTSLTMNSPLSGIGFLHNSSANTNTVAFVCNSGTCSMSGNVLTVDVNFHCYEFWRDGNNINFAVDGASVATLPTTNMPTQFVSTAGMWIETTTAAAQTQVAYLSFARMEGFV